METKPHYLPFNGFVHILLGHWHTIKNYKISKLNYYKLSDFLSFIIRFVCLCVRQWWWRQWGRPKGERRSPLVLSVHVRSVLQEQLDGFNAIVARGQVQWCRLKTKKTTLLVNTTPSGWSKDVRQQHLNTTDRYAEDEQRHWDTKNNV